MVLWHCAGVELWAYGEILRAVRQCCVQVLLSYLEETGGRTCGQ